MTSDSQSAYHLSRVVRTHDVDADVRAAMRLYMVEDLGIPETVADRRASIELERNIPKSVIRELRDRGVVVEGRNVLDLGAGLGGMSEELVLAGAHVTALEPGAAWAELTRRRVERHHRPFELLVSFGESIPLQNDSVDVIVSLQVLEHVRSPAAVLSEAWRVLRPGGHFFLACENYLAFREAHYQVFWLPMLPKSIGRVYLKMLGRPTKFLEESVTYTTFPGVVGTCRRLGFVRMRDDEIERNLQSVRSVKWRLMKILADASGRRLPRALDDARNTFKFGIQELFRKPIPAN